MAYIHWVKRFLLGLLLGITVSGLLWWSLQIAAPTVAQALDSAFYWLMSGALLGLLCAGFVYPAAPSHDNRSAETNATLADQVLYGVGLGVLAWVVLALNLYPVLQGRSPMWQVEAVSPFFPHLLTYTLSGALTTLLYSMLYSVLYRRFANRWQLAEPAVATPEMTTRVVILGGGYAGVSAAQNLEQKLAGDPSVGIWLVSSTNYLLHTPMLSEVAASAVDARHISPPLRSALQHTQVVQALVERVDLEKRTVTLAADGRSVQRTLAFDHLIIAAGAVPNFFGNKSIEQHAFQFKTLVDAMLLRNQIIDMFERADQESDPVKRQAMLTFTVAGGGFAGVELIGSLNDFVRGIATYYPNIDPAEIRLILVHSGETILPELSVALGQYAQEKLAERGVEFLMTTRVTGCNAGQVLLGDDQLASNTFVWTAGNRPSPIVELLGIPLTKRGQVEVDKFLAAPHQPGLWALGDCAQIPDRHSRTGFSPPTAQHALRQGKIVAHNVAATIHHQPLKEWNFKTLGSLSALGHQLAVAEIFGFRFSGLLAWMMWRGIYLSKLPSFEKQVRVGLDWLLDLFFPPDIVQTVDFRRDDTLRKD